MIEERGSLVPRIGLFTVKFLEVWQARYGFRRIKESLKQVRRRNCLVGEIEIH